MVTGQLSELSTMVHMHGMYLCIVHVHNANNLLLHQHKLVVDPSAALSSTAGQNKRMIRGHKHCAFQSD